MPNLANLVVQVGVALSGALKVEQKIKGLRRVTDKYADAHDADMSRIRRSFRQMGRAAARAGAKVRESLGSAVKAMGGLPGVAAAGAAAIAGAAAATFKFVDSQTQAMDQVNKTSQRLGIAIEDYQRLKFAASQSGIEAEQLDKGLLKLNQNLLDMSKGSGKLATEALNEIGLSFEQLQGKSRTEQLQAIADGLTLVGDEGRKSAIAARLFGQRAGPQMSTLLAEGSEGIAQLAAQASGVFSQEDADRATEFQDRLGEVSNMVSGLTTELAVELLPAINDVIVGFRDWISENKDLISQGMKAVITGISDAFYVLKEAIDLALFPLRQIAELLGASADKGQIFKAVMTSMLAPFSAVAAAIRAVNAGLAELGVRLLQAEGGGLANALALVQQAAQVAAAKAEAGAASEEFSQEYGIRAGGGRGGGGGAGKKSAAKKGSALGAFGKLLGPNVFERGARAAIDYLGEKGPQGGVTVDEAIAALLGGRGDVLKETLKGMSQKTVSTASIKPTVAIDFFNFDIEQHISSPNPEAAGAQVAEAIRREFKKATARAGQALASNIVR